MDTDVRFHGVLASEVGLELLNSERPLLAETKSDFVDIPFRNGSVVVFDDSKQDITVNCEFAIMPMVGVSFHDHIRMIRAWLTTRYKERLIFTDDTNFYYLGIATTSVTYERIADYGTFEVSFRCDPYEIDRSGELNGG